MGHLLILLWGHPVHHTNRPNQKAFSSILMSEQNERWEIKESLTDWEGSFFFSFHGCLLWCMALRFAQSQFWLLLSRTTTTTSLELGDGWHQNSQPCRTLLTLSGSAQLDLGYYCLVDDYWEEGALPLHDLLVQGMISSILYLYSRVRNKHACGNWKR